MTNRRATMRFGIAVACLVSAIAAPAHASDLTVTSEPSGAGVLINGEPAGLTPLNVEIPATVAGQCQVEVGMEGYQTVRMAYTLVPNKFEILHFYLISTTPAAIEEEPAPAGTDEVTTPPLESAAPPLAQRTGAPPPAGDRALAAWLGKLMAALNVVGR